MRCAWPAVTRTPIQSQEMPLCKSMQHGRWQRLQATEVPTLPGICSNCCSKQLQPAPAADEAAPHATRHVELCAHIASPAFQLCPVARATCQKAKRHQRHDQRSLSQTKAQMCQAHIPSHPKLSSWKATYRHWKLQCLPNTPTATHLQPHTASQATSHAELSGRPHCQPGENAHAARSTTTCKRSPQAHSSWPSSLAQYPFCKKICPDALG